MLLPLGMAADLRLPKHRSYATVDPVEKLERRIAEKRMTAALDLDWDQLHLRSRAIVQQLTQEEDPTLQIAEARQIRSSFLQSEDTPGLRALRLATAAPMVGWLQNSSANAAAQNLGRLLAADQRETIPGLASLEDELAKAQRRSR